jgi:iron(III) transport system substrate-binding protein
LVRGRCDGICYNPVRVKAAGLKPPRTWEDLTAKEWNGRFALFSGSWEWYAAMQRFYGKERADALMRAYAANQPRLEASHQLGIELTISGEVLAAANVYGYGCLVEKMKGSSIELVSPVPTVIEVGTVGILKDAPHPNAARLFDCWLLSRETQQWMADTLGRIVPRKDVANNPVLMNRNVRLLVSDTSDLDALNAAIKAFKGFFDIPA